MANRRMAPETVYADRYARMVRCAAICQPAVLCLPCLCPACALHGPPFVLLLISVNRPPLPPLPVSTLRWGYR